MPEKFDPDTSPGVRLLRIFRKLALNNRKYYQIDLAREFDCSAQTIIRIMADIEAVIGPSLQTGLDCRRRWYRIEEPGRLTGLAHMPQGMAGGVCGVSALMARKAHPVEVEKSFMVEGAPEILGEFDQWRQQSELAAGIGQNIAFRINSRQFPDKKEFWFAPYRVLNLLNTPYAPGIVLGDDLVPEAFAMLNLEKAGRLEGKRKIPPPDFEGLEKGHELPWLEDDPLFEQLRAKIS